MGRLEVRGYSPVDATTPVPRGDAVQTATATLGVRGRSSSGWPKRSFGLELVNSPGNATPQDQALLGFPSDNDFVLHSLWSDKSMARNNLIYRVAGELQDWAPRTRYVELWGTQLDGDDTVVYQGVYLAVEKIKAASHRVPIRLATDADPSGGYLFQIDWSDDDTWSDGRWKTLNLVVKRPSALQLMSSQQIWIGDWIVGLESTLRATPVGNWRAYLDEPSFVDFLLLNELGKNVDGYRLSTFLHKAAGGKLKAGPVWDFDLGMANDGRSYDPSGWVLLGELDPLFSDMYPAFWWNEMLHDAAFRKALRQRWTELRHTSFSKEHLLNLVDQTVQTVTPAVDRNYAKWPSLNTNGDLWWTPWPLYGITAEAVDPSAYTYSDHVRSLKRWLADRLSWLDSDAAWAELDDWAANQDLHIDQGGNL